MQSVALIRQARSFAVVGAVGFLIDGGVLTLLHGGFGLDLVRGRLVSFSLAVTITWALNRALTFPHAAHRTKVTQWIVYALVHTTGAGINLGIFLLLVEAYPLMASYPLLPLAVAASLAMIFNFFASRRLVFPSEGRGDRSPALSCHVGAFAMSDDASYSGTDNLEVMREAVNYNRYLCELVRRFGEDASSALDFGAGVGTFSDCLKNATREITCVEPDERQREHLLAKGYAAVHSLSELSEKSFSYVFTLNVLEHIEGDQHAAGELFRVLKPGGRLFVYVPAFAVLFSSMDKKVGHYRRYRLAPMKRLLEAAGFQIEAGAYTDVLGFLASLLFKLVDRAGTGDLDVRAIRLYDRWVFPVSRILSPVFGKLAGKNLFVAARRPYD